MLWNVTQGEAAPAACCTTEADALSAAGWAGVNMGAERRGRGGGKGSVPLQCYRMYVWMSGVWSHS